MGGLSPRVRAAATLAGGCALVAAVYWLNRRRRAPPPPLDVGTAGEAKEQAPAADTSKVNVLNVQRLARRWGRKKKVDHEETPFHHAITELRELGATLAAKKDVEGAEAIERAVALLSTLRLSSHGSSHESHRKSFNQLIGQIEESGEAVGIRQWVSAARTAAESIRILSQPRPTRVLRGPCRRLAHERWRPVRSAAPVASPHVRQTPAHPAPTRTAVPLRTGAR